MPESDVLVNRVQQSGLITLDLADLLPPSDELVSFDLKPFLVKEMVLMEKPFRESMKAHDWSAYKGKTVAIHCTTDALVPHWAYMLVTSYLEGQAAKVAFGDVETVTAAQLLQNIRAIDTQQYRDARVVIKGCGDKTIPASAYLEITHKLRPVVKSLMYGEPCSTVPVYKKKS